MMTDIYSHCTLCPRECGADRYSSKGFCGEGSEIRIARAELHQWEEPCLSPGGRSGTVFFSGCQLGCVYCQNYRLSSEHMGFMLSEQQLADTFLRLKDLGAENIDLVSPTHFVPSIIKALDMVKHKLDLPVIYNCGGYEKTETLEMLRGYVDIFLPDMKYMDSSLSSRLSKAPDYFSGFGVMLDKMLEITGKPCFDSSGKMLSGVIVRHLVLPGCRHDSAALMQWLGENYSADSLLVSLMNQFTPVFKAAEYGLSRRTFTFEYQTALKELKKAGFDGFVQERSSAAVEYIPVFYDHLYYDLSNT